MEQEAHGAGGISYTTRDTRYPAPCCDHSVLAGCCNPKHPLYEVGVTCLKGWVEKKVDSGATPRVVIIMLIMLSCHSSLCSLC